MKSQSALGSGCGILFLGVWCLGWSVGTLFFDYWCVSGVLGQWRAQSYPTADATIIRSGVTVSRSSDGGPSKGLDIEYTFTVNGMNYRGTKYRYRDMSDSSGRAERLADRYRVGAVCPVYYNPEDPTDCVLWTKIDGSDLFMAMFLTPFNIVMLGAWWGMLSSMGIVGGTSKDEKAEPDIRQVGDTEILLISQISPFAVAMLTLLGSTFACIFILGFAYQFQPPLFRMIFWWLANFIIMGVVWYRTKRKRRDDPLGIAVNRSDGILTLPAAEGRKRKLDIDISSVRELSLKRMIHSEDDSSSTTATFTPVIIIQEDGDRKRSANVYRFKERDKAEVAMNWLSDATGLQWQESR